RGCGCKAHVGAGQFAGPQPCPIHDDYSDRWRDDGRGLVKTIAELEQESARAQVEASWKPRRETVAFVLGDVVVPVAVGGIVPALSTTWRIIVAGVAVAIALVSLTYYLRRSLRRDIETATSVRLLE